MEYPGSFIKGTYRDQLFDAEGIMKYDSGWNDNTIMNSFHVLLARLVTHDADLFKDQPRSLVMRFGKFSNAWTSLAVAPAEENLTDPYPDFFLQENSGLVVAYLDDNGVAQTNPSNRVQITTTLGPKMPADAVCPLGEFAVYIRYGTPANNPVSPDDHIINHVRHYLISKAPTDTLIRQIRFTF